MKRVLGPNISLTGAIDLPPKILNWCSSWKLDVVFDAHARLRHTHALILDIIVFKLLTLITCLFYLSTLREIENCIVYMKNTECSPDPNLEKDFFP